MLGCVCGYKILKIERESFLHHLGATNQPELLFKSEPEFELASVRGRINCHMGYGRRNT